MLFKIEGYFYNPQDVEILKADAFLHIEPLDYQPLNIREYFKMRKSLKLLERLEKAGGIPPGIKPEHQAKAAAKYPTGTRWITIHPQGREKGVPVLIRDTGEGTAHIIGGAGGRLNMMRLSNIKSPEEYKAKVQERKEAEQAKKEEKKEEERKYLEKLTKEEKKEYKEAKKLKKQEKKEKELTKEEKIVETEESFADSVAKTLGWDLHPIEKDYDNRRIQLEKQLEQLQLFHAGNPLIEKIQKELKLLEKAKKRALKSQRKNVIAHAKEVIRKFQRDMIDDVDLRQEVEKRIEEPSQAGEAIKTEIGQKGKGFIAEYRESAEEKGKLTESVLKERKEEEFEKRMEQIADEISPKAANFIRKGVETNKDINRIKKTIYEEREEHEIKIKDVDTKTTLLKKYLEMKHKLEEVEKEEPKGIDEVQITLDGASEEQVAEEVNDLKYGNGVKLDWMPSSEDLARSLMEEEERLQSERQSALNGSFLQEIEKNKDGAEKWIANGNYNGFNSISLAVLKYEGLNRDTVDLLGIGSSAELLATLIRRNTSPEDYQDIAQGMEAYHDEINEGIVKEALEKGQELLNRAETIQEEIANNPNDLAVLNELNETRLQYLNKANQIMGQALGSLEASAAMVVTLKKIKDPERIDTNLGRISTEEAIVRMRALGLRKDDYEIHSIAGNKIITIEQEFINKLINSIDRKEVNLQNEIEAIKVGTQDQEGWLPDGVVFRPESSFQDPETKDMTVAKSFSFTGDTNADVNRMISERIADGMLMQDIIGDLLSPETLQKIPSDQMSQYSSLMKDLGIMGGGKKDYLIVERKMNTIAEDYLRDNSEFKNKHIDFQSLPVDKNTTEAIHRSLGAVPEGSFAFKSTEDLTPQEMTDLRRYWEKNIYEGTMAQTTAGREFKTGEGKSKTGLWNSFLNQNGKNKQSAFEVIKNDLITNHSTEDMFGMQEVPPLAKVKEKDWDTYRRNVMGVNDLFIEIENIETDLEQGFIENKEQARKVIEEKKAELPDKLTELYESQMRDHYIKYMSGATEAELEAGEVRREQTSWGEYVRMHGDVKRSQETILDKIKGDFLKEYARNHGRVHGEPIKTGVKKIANWEDHVLGTLDKEMRDNILNKVQAEMQSATAKVAERKGGKFAAGVRRDRALQLLEEIRKQDQAQLGLFGEEEVKQDDGSEIITIGKRAEVQLKSLIPEVSTNFRRGEKVKVFAGMTMSSDKHIQQQRAIKMFEKAKRINISFGTGKGKSIVSIGAFTNLKSKGKVSRAIYAVPSVVQAQFGCVTGDTILYDPIRNKSLTFREMKNQKVRPFVYSLTESGKLIILLASIPFIKGQDLMYEVKLDNGNKIIVTGKHRFLTERGWEYLMELNEGSCVFSGDISMHEGTCVYDLPSIQDYQSDYHLFDRFYGGRPHCHEDIGLNIVPLRGYVHQHNLRNQRGDDFLQESLHNHVDKYVHHANYWPYYLDGDKYYQHAQSPSQQVLIEQQTGNNQSVLQSRSKNDDLVEPICVIDLHPCDNCNNYGFLSHILLSDDEQWYNSSRVLQQCHALKDLDLSIQQERFSQFGFLAYSYLRTNRIISISPLNCQDVYDIEIPLTHNYWCQGFWNHNSEMLKYTEPGKYNWNANPGMSREERIVALKDNKLDMAVFTHQSLRDDMIYLLSSHINKSENETKKYFNSISQTERKKLMKEVMDKEGIESDIMLVVDESHYTTKRKGKPDSTLANVLDALNQNTPYFMNQSATPVKNDASEAFDMLKKIDPQKFNDRNEFIKRYGIDSSFTKESLRRLISRYNYASPTVTGVRRNEKKETIKLSKEQIEAHKQVESAFKRTQKAHRAGKADIEAMKLLSPNSFKGISSERHEDITRRLQESIGVIKEEALNRVVNQHPHGTNAKIQKVLNLISEKVYMADHPASGAKVGDMQPGVIFAHNIESINQIQKALGEYGVRVGVIQGSLSGKEKDIVKNAFNPPNPKDRKYDILLCSDAGATGINLQNAKYLMNYDLPHTSWVREQRMGRIDRHGQLHEEIDYHDIVTDTEHEKIKWDRIQRKAELGAVFQLDPGSLDDVGLASYIDQVKQYKYNQGLEGVA